MPETDSFAELIRRVRAGAGDAADELWRHYEPMLRREVRLRLRDPRLRQRFDENDVCQSVMASFFVRLSAGEFDFDGPEQLQGLLVKMGRNKLASQTRRQQAEKRDCRRGEALPNDSGLAVGAHASPSQVVGWRELLERARAGLTDEERQVSELRAQGQSWVDIASMLGGTADGRRMQLNRALGRLCQELGLKEDSDG
jgi:DNA-directed RNA polymerase specialized sigma24 family protein